MQTSSVGAEHALPSWTALTVPTADVPLPARLYRPARTHAATPLVLMLHGGKFIDGSLDSGDALARTVAEAGAVVLAIEYLKPPVHPFPEGLNSAFDALLWAREQRASLAGKRAALYVGGAEAGANLAAALAMMARDQQRPELGGQILISPMVDPCLGSGSLRAAHAGSAGCSYAIGWQQYLGASACGDHPYAAPGCARRLGGVAPALVITTDGHPLRDESLRLAKRLQDAGVDVQSHCVSIDADPAPAQRAWITSFLARPKR